jgi:hypothetical protein
MIEQSRGGLFVLLDRRRVEGLLGLSLPDGVEDLRYLIWQPSSDLAYLEALVRFAAPDGAYQALVQALGLVPFAQSGPGVHLPIDWSPPPEVAAPDWWQPGPETPPDAAGGPLGVYGSIAAKRLPGVGLVYLRIVDTGHRTAGDEP